MSRTGYINPAGAVASCKRAGKATPGELYECALGKLPYGLYDRRDVADRWAREAKRLALAQGANLGRPPRFVVTATSIRSAQEAIAAARAGRCDAARYHLKVAGYNQGRKAQASRNAALAVVAQLCAGRLNGAKRRRRKKGR